jgi:hypothetical protein
MLKKIGAIMEGIAGLIIALKFLWFIIVGNFTSEAVSKFLVEIITFGVNESIPLEVTIIQFLGILGVVLIIADLIIFRGE